MKGVENEVLISVAEFLKKEFKIGYRTTEKRAGMRVGKISQMKIGRTSTNKDEIHAVLIAYPEATQFYLDTVQKLGLNSAGYEWALAIEKLLKNLHSRESIAEKLGVSLTRLKAMQKNIDGIGESDRNLIFEQYPELSLLPSFNPDESEESLALRIKQLEQEVRELRKEVKDDELLREIKLLREDINKLK